MKSINPYGLFVGVSIAAWVIFWLFSSMVAAVVLGTVLAAMLDPPVLITGLIVGLIGNTYRGFAVAVYPVALIVGVGIVIAFINPWLAEMQLPVAGFWVYVSKVYAVLLLAHLSHLVRDAVIKRQMKKAV